MDHLSFKRDKGYFDPGGNNGGGSAGVALEVPVGCGGLSDFNEFPALPDFTMPFLGGIHVELAPDFLVVTRRSLTNRKAK